MPRGLVLVVAVLLALVPSPARAEGEKVGDRVVVDVNMSSSPDGQRWRQGTITAIQTWQGQVSGITVKLEDGLEVTTATRFMRAAPAGSPPSEAAADASAATPTYAVGDRVTADANMSSDPAMQSWRPGSITAVQEWQGEVSGITVRLDDGSEITTAARFLRQGTVTGSVVRDVAPAAAVSTPDAAGGDAGTGNCRVGLRVTDRENRNGVVVRAEGASCHVKLDGTGEERSYLQWMLAPEGQAQPRMPEGTAQHDAGAPMGGALEPGTYSCWTPNGVAGTMQLVIRSATEYADGKGTTGAYVLDAATGRIQWTSGPWAGSFGTKLGPAKIGISSRPDGFSSTVCDKK